MFKQQYTVEDRIKQCDEIKRKYPSRIPLIVETKKESELKLSKNKYLVEQNMTIGQFIYILIRRLNLKPEEALFMFIQNTIFPTETLVSEIYKKAKDEDGFLYCVICSENTFGNQTL